MYYILYFLLLVRKILLDLVVVFADKWVSLFRYLLHFWDQIYIGLLSLYTFHHFLSQLHNLFEYFDKESQILVEIRFLIIIDEEPFIHYIIQIYIYLLM